MTSHISADKAERFRHLHQQATALLMPNAWDPGSAKLIAGVGFEAIATSSGAAASVLGRKDGQLTRDEALAHAQAIVDAVDVPVSADLENGFGAELAAVTETIRRAGDIGLAGGSIEDSPAEAGPYDFGHAVERVAAAVEAARALGRPFTLTARTENYLRGKPDLDDTIRRLQAFEKAGADVLFGPRAARPGGGAPRVPLAHQALQLHGGHPRQVVQRGRAAGRRRQAHQFRHLLLPRRDARRARGRHRGEGTGHVHLPQEAMSHTP
jgi:2-methylisocitrate lyase-like PEP mutase family enzyme